MNIIWDDTFSIEIDGYTYDVDFIATGNYYYTPGTMYRRNGDPGDPPEEEWTVERVEIEFIFVDGEENDNISETIYNKLIDEITCAFEDGEYEGEVLD